VSCIPGSPLDPRAAGTNDLIKLRNPRHRGRRLIQRVAPIMERPAMHPAGEPDSEPFESIHNPHDRGQITACSARCRSRSTTSYGCPAPTPAIVRTVLLSSSLSGRLERHGGGLVLFSKA